MKPASSPAEVRDQAQRAIELARRGGESATNEDWLRGVDGGERLFVHHVTTTEPSARLRSRFGFVMVTG